MCVVRRVVCAVSGGIDSAVAALLLKRSGVEVIGVYMVNWNHVEEGISDCPRTRDEADAMKICKRLGIQFHVVDFTRQYWSEVFQDLLENYRKGCTVVSDVLCNRIIKFNYLHEFAFKQLNADAVATGHFARTNLGNLLQNRSTKSVARLYTAVDPLKDQTYFLSTLTQDQLKRSIFPIGSLTKPQIKQIAIDAQLNEVINKREYIEPTKGFIRNVHNGDVIAEHNGVHHFTLGKRVRLSPKLIQTAFGFFVASLDYQTQTVWVCEGSLNAALFATKFIISEPHWIAESLLMHCGEIEFRCQRSHPPFQCTVTRLNDGSVQVTPRNPIRAAASGQSCVFYRNDECLGSGQIERVTATLAD
ncbi:unnamed protein product [Anisakis simplex]|uniref:tRNA-5-taurinomethyluridine 2-sulfurtransferase n=1 Tax=Anisakis simplex TaxID=6269 RepID=A0A0M3JVK8_ANISI|nr:unnamed protein product [Anisakis simplex]